MPLPRLRLLLTLCPPDGFIIGPPRFHVLSYRDPEKQREAARRHYEQNREKMIARAREHTKRKRVELRAWVRDYLATHPCVDCGEADPLVLEFDHRDPASKIGNIGDIVGRSGWGLPRLQAEIDKCDVRCANCHRRRTCKNRHWQLPAMTPSSDRPASLRNSGYEKNHLR